MATPFKASGGALLQPVFTPSRRATFNDTSLAPGLGTVTTLLTRQAVSAAVAYTGSAIAYTATKRVVIQVVASQPVTVIMETSSDGGTTWPLSAFDTVPGGGVAHYGLITPAGGSTHFRFRVLASGANSEVSLAYQQIT